ncbi:MAG: DNA cytosine methyltransferase [Parasphingorhabdus sp.]
MEERAIITDRGYAVVDLFAGPGGLAEGFSAVRAADGERAFRIALSVEMDPAAHSTLLLRSFLRQFPDKLPAEYYDFLNAGAAEPDWSDLFPQEWEAATDEALLLTLGQAETATIVDAKLEAIRKEYGGNTILIGGPPCQAYSLVGRARNQGKDGYVAESDHRHRLYEEYVRILEQLRPAAFVMENVKGMLSSSLDGSRIFERVLDDLRGAGGPDSYTLVALSPDRSGKHNTSPASSDFVIRTEDYGVPQARHRVIVVGIRKDVHAGLGQAACETLRLDRRDRRTTVRDVIGDMPALRSGLSRKPDNIDDWKKAVLDGADRLQNADAGMDRKAGLAFRKRLAECRKSVMATTATLTRKATGPVRIAKTCPADLREWIVDPAISALSSHETRGHMASDLSRYLFAAIHGEVTGKSPKSGDFPDALAPDHRNWNSGKFADRFRVQLYDNPSTTITSHISKDGHYFIHPDANQCRSLTVREAARLQTFPDNYFFKGNRTQQFVQVGNAVPPFIAKQIGEVLHSVLAEGSRDNQSCYSNGLELPGKNAARLGTSESDVAQFELDPL